MIDSITADVDGYSIKDIVDILVAKYGSSEEKTIEYVAKRLLPYEDIPLVASKKETGQQNDEIVSASKVGIYLCALAEYFGDPEFTWNDHTVELGRPSLKTYRKILTRLFRIKREDANKIVGPINIPLLNDTANELIIPDMKERGRKGGKKSKIDPGLQQAINNICKDLFNTQKNMTIGEITAWFSKNDANANYSSFTVFNFEPQLDSCCDLYIDGDALVYKRYGAPKSIKLISLNPYITRAKISVNTSH